MNEIDSFLNKIQEIIIRNEEILKLKGETFNIFSILNLATKENGLHSRFLKELLDSNGSHGLKNLFLDIFVNYLRTKLKKTKSGIEFEFETENSNTFTEKNIGIVNSIEKTGGRIDILIQSKNRKSEIIIENKIYAREQKDQIERYCTYAKSRKSKVFYLTLFGETSNSPGVYKLDEDYFLLSYSTDIINWLELCRKEVSDYPIIRETIKQYIIILKKLTGQLTDNKMDNEVKKLILNNYVAALQIKSSLDKIEDDVKNFWNSVRDKISGNPKIAEKKWKISINSQNIIIDILNHDRGNFNVYLENIYSSPFYCIWINKPKYNIAEVNKYLKDNIPEWVSSDNYIYKSETGYDFTNSGTKLIMYDLEEREKLLNEFSETIIELALYCEKHLLELNKLKYG